MSSLGDRPGVVVHGSPRPEVVGEQTRSQENAGKIRDARPPRRRGEEEKEERAEPNRERQKIKRKVRECPIQALPPEDSSNSEAAQRTGSISHENRELFRACALEH